MEVSPFFSNAAETERIKALHQNQNQTRADFDMFQKLFLAELNAQDPLDPINNQDFLTQMAQFSSLEQLQAMNDKLDLLTDDKSLGDAAALIGKNVTGILNSADFIGEVNGIVDGIHLVNKEIFLDLESGVSIKIDDLLSVRQAQIIN